MVRFINRLKEKIDSFDYKISQYIATHLSTKSKKVERIYAKSGNTFPWFVFTLICFIFGFLVPRYALIIQWIAMGITFIVIMAIKFSVKRKRPVDDLPPKLVGKADHYSFPSGHAGRMGTLAAFMSLLFPKVGWIFIIWAIFVGFGRIVMRVHYFLDIISGIILGATVGTVFYLIRNQIEQWIEPIIYWMSQYLL